MKNDGSVVTCGDANEPWTTIPKLKGGLKYLQIAAATRHTLLVRSDGAVVACGMNANQFAIPSSTSKSFMSKIMSNQNQQCSDKDFALCKPHPALGVPPIPIVSLVAVEDLLVDDSIVFNLSN